MEEIKSTEVVNEAVEAENSAVAEIGKKDKLTACETAILGGLLVVGYGAGKLVEIGVKKGKVLVGKIKEKAAEKKAKAESTVDADFTEVGPEDVVEE